MLKIDGITDMPFVSLADGDVRVGDWVVAIGNPYGLGGTVTAGIISSLGRDIAGSAYGDFIQIDAAVNTGNQRNEQRLGLAMVGTTVRGS